MIKKPMMAGLAVTLMASAALADENWTTTGFDMPESVVFDAPRDRVILSTIIGDPGAADGQGSLVLLTPEGELINDGWTTGMNAPKGLSIVGDILLVADLTQLHEVDLITGEIRRSLDAPGAVFLDQRHF